MTHKCHAPGCKTPVPPRLFMCRPHWKALPADLRERVEQHYRSGQCDDKNPSKEWVIAAWKAQMFFNPKMKLMPWMEEYENRRMSRDKAESPQVT